MKKGIIFLLVFLFSFSLVNAISFTGYVNGNLGSPVSISSVSIANSCEGLTSTQCHTYGSFDQCFSCDTFGSGYQNYDGYGDTARYCFWDYGTSACYNGIKYGNALPVSGGVNPNCNGDLQCFWGNPSDPDCDWIKGSWVSRSGYCGGGEIHYPSFRQDCDGSEDQYGRGFFTSGSINYQIPTASSYSNDGMCFDTCEENGASVTDYELCSYGSTLSDVNLDYASNYCPEVDYSDTCYNSVTYRNYSCDGSPIYSPGDMGYNYLSTHGRLDGTDAIYEDVDCSLLYPAEGPLCMSNCGSLLEGAGNNICLSERSVGVCNSNSCQNGERQDLDGSVNLVNDFNVQCGAGYLGDIQWAQGGALNSYNFYVGSIGNYGEYSNGFSSIQYVTLSTPVVTVNVTQDRSSFDWGACGDDEKEYNIGGLCCDDPTDYVVSIPDGNLTDAIDAAGDYCVNQNGCGDGSVNAAAGEQCDAAYVQEMVVVINPWTIVSNETHLVFGDDSGCTVGEMCDINCQCVLPENYGNSTPEICGDNVINVAGEECDGLNLDNQTCVTQGFAEGNISCYIAGNANECTFNTSSCVSAPSNIAGPNEYLVYEDCEDDGDGDEYGIAITNLYAANGNHLGNQTTICALDIEEIPFFSISALLISLLVLFTFYSNDFRKLFKRRD